MPKPSPMKNIKLLICLFLLSTTISFSQQLPREPLHGQIVADSLGVSNVSIKNSNTKKVAISDSEGNFTIYAREKDTLVFSNLSFVSKKLVLTKTDFKFHILRIKLDVFVNSLDEVVVSPNALTGDLQKDDKNIKLFKIAPVDTKSALVQVYEADRQTSPVNTLMPGYVNMNWSPDLVKIIKLFSAKSKPKTLEEQGIYVSEKVFSEAVKERFSDVFFTDTLKLKKEQIGLFLVYCENVPNVRELLDPKKEFELVDFLIEKSKEYKLTMKK